MTLANKITVLRILAIPLFIIAFIEHHYIAARFIFILSVSSDALDGAIARIRGERTTLGSFLDPLADKLLLVATFIAFASVHMIPLWVFIVIFSQDLLVVLGWTLVYILTGNSKITPRPLGKTTTALQMAFAVAVLFKLPGAFCNLILYATIASTILSALDYIWLGNKRLAHLE
jgi:cardiolipin synthase